MAIQFSGKRLQIDRAKAVIVGAVGTATFVVIFSIVASKALLSQRAYQARVTKEQEKAVKQLNENKTTADKLITAYQQFAESSPTNIIGGDPLGKDSNSGDNGRIILDALPSKYDFPALANSIESILKANNYSKITVIGTDDEVAQGNTQPAADPSPITIPFKFGFEGAYDQVLPLIDLLQRSIRPINIQSITFAAKADNVLHIDVSANTYYLPEKQLNFPTKVIK